MNYGKMIDKIHRYIAKWERSGYPNGIPDEAPIELESAGIVPSYRLICKAILKNDFTCKTLGYEREPCSMYNCLKKEQLIRDNKIRIVAVQPDLFGGVHYECT
jgi:predicted phosphoadenosine phosphosulfate sulfurtransferase